MSDEIVDKRALQSLLDVIGGNMADLQELLDEFEAETPNIITKMKKAADEGDLNALRVSVHSLKSNGRDFGANSLAKLCESLEHACKDGVVDDPVADVKTISEELERTRSALANFSFGD